MAFALGQERLVAGGIDIRRAVDELVPGREIEGQQAQRPPERPCPR